MLSVALLDMSGLFNAVSCGVLFPPQPPKKLLTAQTGESGCGH